MKIVKHARFGLPSNTKLVSKKITGRRVPQVEDFAVIENLDQDAPRLPKYLYPENLNRKLRRGLNKRRENDGR
jgi:hypothetical protein